MAKLRHIISSLFIGLLISTSYADEIEPLPALELPDIQGKIHNLDAWQGKVILLNFWASWCTPCQTEIKDFVRYQTQYAERNLQIVSVGIDKADKLDNVRRSLGINYPILVSQPEQNIMPTWGNPNGVLPYTVVINPQRQITYTRAGLFNEDLFQQFVLPLLSSPSPNLPEQAR